MADGIRLEFSDHRAVEKCLETDTNLKLILKDLCAKLHRRPDVDSITAVLWIYENELLLFISHKSVLILHRRKRLFRRFWSRDYLSNWQTNVQPEIVDCPITFTPHNNSLIVEVGREVFAYNHERDKECMQDAVRILVALPQLLLEAHFDIVCLASIRLKLYNEYLVDLLSSDNFQCLTQARFTSLPAVTLYQEVKGVLEKCGSRLLIFERVLESDSEIKDSLCLVREFQSAILHLWNCF